MKSKIIKLLSVLLFTAILFQTVACGTILYPERRGQTAGRIDPTVVILDGIGLLFFLLPGVIAFAVDLVTGAIYLPKGHKSFFDASFTYPVITVLLEPVFSGEWLKFSDVLIATIMFAGIIIIVPKFDISKGVIAGIFSAITFSLRNILHRKYTSHYPGPTIMFYQIIVVIIALLP